MLHRLSAMPQGAETSFAQPEGVTTIEQPYLPFLGQSLGGCGRAALEAAGYEPSQLG